MSLIVIHPIPDSGWADMRLEHILSGGLKGVEHQVIRRAEELRELRGHRVLFAVPLGQFGINMEYIAMLRRLRCERRLLEGCVGHRISA